METYRPEFASLPVLEGFDAGTIGRKKCGRRNCITPGHTGQTRAGPGVPVHHDHLLTPPGQRHGAEHPD